MKRSPLFSFLAAGVLILLLASIGGFYWLFKPNTLGLFRSETTPNVLEAAMFLPRQAPVMVSILVNPDRSEADNATGGSSKKHWSGAELNQLKQSLLANTGFDYQRDIQPWLGDEITLAVTTLDIDHNSENGRQPGYLIALPTKDPNKSREFLQLLFSQRALTATELTFEQYKGVKLIYNQVRPQLDKQKALDKSPHARAQKALYSALVGDSFVLFANHPKVLRDAINNVQAAALNLNSSSQYQQALTVLPSQRIGTIFLNLPIVGKWLGQESQPLYESQLIALERTSEGLLAEMTLLATASQNIAPNSPDLSEPVKALQYLPSATGFAISGCDLSHLGNTDLAQLWSQVSGTLSSSGYSILPQLISQPLTEIQTQWGINLPKDIFSWIKGEYALGLLPSSNQEPPDWIFVAEKSDNLETGIAHLDKIATEQGLSASAFNLENQKISAWTQLKTTSSSLNPNQQSITLNAKVKGLHTTVGNYEIFTTSLQAMGEALKAPQLGSLADNPNFQTSMSFIPQPNQGYLYLDWQATREILENQLPILQFVEIAGGPFLQNLQSLTLGSYGNEQESLKANILFRFQAKT